MSIKEDEICDTCKKYIIEGEILLKMLMDERFDNLKGINKLNRKIKKEVLFLSQTLQNDTLKKEHLKCTNLHFFKALMQEVLKQDDYEAVLETFSFKAINNCKKRLTVDIVSCKGQRWVKVIARKPTALNSIYKDGDAFGRRSVMDQATSYVEAATQNLHLYAPPQIVFSFINGVPEKMKIYLEKLGITVDGEVIILEDDSVTSDSSSSEELFSEECDITFTTDSSISKTPSVESQMCSNKLNLCVTAMIAYVSSLTNGGCHFTFAEPLLNQQAEWERLRPVKQFLNHIFKGKELICCLTAVDDFKNIVDMVGGDSEKQRAADLLSRIKVVPDVTSLCLRPSGKIKKRSLVIFGTGDEHKALTVTANKGFVHAAKQKGVKFAVIIHESRALTERKQLPETSQDFSHCKT